MLTTTSQAQILINNAPAIRALKSTFEKFARMAISGIAGSPSSDGIAFQVAENGEQFTATAFGRELLFSFRVRLDGRSIAYGTVTCYLKPVVPDAEKIKLIYQFDLWPDGRTSIEVEDQGDRVEISVSKDIDCARVVMDCILNALLQ